MGAGGAEGAEAQIEHEYEKERRLHTSAPSMEPTSEEQFSDTACSKMEGDTVAA